MAPTQPQIRDMFKPLSIQGSQSKFFDHVDDKVNWEILGHSPLSRTYTSKQEFIKETLTFLGEKVMTAPLILEVLNVSGGGASGPWATIEMVAVGAECKNGLRYDMHYCWICEFDENDKIVRVRAYLDTKLLTDTIEQNV